MRARKPPYDMGVVAGKRFRFAGKVRPVLKGYEVVEVYEVLWQIEKSP